MNKKMWDKLYCLVVGWLAGIMTTILIDVWVGVAGDYISMGGKICLTGITFGAYYLCWRFIKGAKITLRVGK